MTYDNSKSHKKTGFHLLFRRYIFGKTTEGGQIDPLAVLGLIALDGTVFDISFIGNKFLIVYRTIR